MDLRNACMTALRIKGFAKPELLAEVLGADPAATTTVITALLADDLATETRLGAKLTEAGKAEETTLLEAERAAIAADAMQAAFDGFNALNGPFKALITDWQTRDIDGEAQPNDHSDAAYDGAVMERLNALDADTRALCATLAGLSPRMGQYGPRFARALERIKDGEPRYVAAPLIDSYHTVWFELHEDLITLSGRTRAEEAAAGRAL